MCVCVVGWVDMVNKLGSWVGVKAWVRMGCNGIGGGLDRSDLSWASKTAEPEEDLLVPGPSARLLPVTRRCGSNTLIR